MLVADTAGIAVYIVDVLGEGVYVVPAVFTRFKVALRGDQNVVHARCGHGFRYVEFRTAHAFKHRVVDGYAVGKVCVGGVLHVAYGEHYPVAADIHLRCGGSVQLFDEEDVVYIFKPLAARARLHIYAQPFHSREYGAGEVFEREHALAARYGRSAAGKHQVGLSVQGNVRRAVFHADVSAVLRRHSRLHSAGDVRNAAREHEPRVFAARDGAFDIRAFRVYCENAIQGKRAVGAEYARRNRAFTDDCIRIQLQTAGRVHLQGIYGYSALAAERIARYRAYTHVAGYLQRAVHGQGVFVEIYHRRRRYFKVAVNGYVLLQIYVFSAQVVPVHRKQVFCRRHGQVVGKEYRHGHHDRDQNRHRQHARYHSDYYLLLAGHRLFHPAALIFLTLFPAFGRIFYHSGIFAAGILFRRGFLFPFGKSGRFGGLFRVRLCGRLFRLLRGRLRRVAGASGFRRRFFPRRRRYFLCAFREVFFCGNVVRGGSFLLRAGKQVGKIVRLSVTSFHIILLGENALPAPLRIYSTRRLLWRFPRRRARRCRCRPCGRARRARDRTRAF